MARLVTRIDGAADVIRRFLVPATAGVTDIHLAEQRFAAVRGHPMAKAAVHTALLDARLRAAGMPLGGLLGAVRATVPAGVSVGIMDDVGELLDAVAAARHSTFRGQTRVGRGR